MGKKRLPKGVRKYIRRKKAEEKRRGESFSFSDEEFVKKLKEKLNELR